MISVLGGLRFIPNLDQKFWREYKCFCLADSAIYMFVHAGFDPASRQVESSRPRYVLNKGSSVDPCGRRVIFHKNWNEAERYFVHVF